MKRFLAIVGAAASATALWIPAQGSSPIPVSWHVGSWFFDNPIEQQTPCSPNGTGCGASQPDRTLWVNNVPNPFPDVSTYRCAWDPDDDVDAFFAGNTLAAGATLSGSLCEVVDDNPHQVLLGPLPAGISGTVAVGNYLTLNVAAGQRAMVALVAISLGGRGLMWRMLLILEPRHGQRPQATRPLLLRLLSGT